MQIVPVGECWLSVTVPVDDTALSSHIVRSLSARLHDAALAGLVSTRPGLDSLLIEFAAGFEITQLEKIIRSFVADSQTERPQKAMRLPVCNHPSFAPDLPQVALKTNLTTDEILQKFYQNSYEVWMIGFMPGYPYMGRLDSSLQLTRKETPALNVSAGSIAIAEEYVGIYPFDSPGGWHVIGRTPISIIDYSKQKPCFFDYGMRVEFYPITQNEFMDASRW